MSTRLSRIAGSGRARKSHEDRWREERQNAVHALLNRHWITKQADPDLFLTIRDHFKDLRDWFYDHAGYALLLTRNFAKLEKIPGSFQPWMGIDGFQNARDYALFTFGLWFLEGRGEGEQFLLSEMVETIRDYLVSIGTGIDWTLYDHRLSMVRALKKLRELDVLVVVDGDEGDWAREGSGTNVLYESSPLSRYVLRRFPRELMSYKRIEDLELETSQALPQGASTDGDLTPPAAITARRHRVFRRLMLEPVVYDWQWTEEERRYVQTQRATILDQLHRTFGFEGRRFREGLFLYWPQLTGEMDLFPTRGAVSDLVLLLAGTIRRDLANDASLYDRDADGSLALTRAEFDALLIRLRARHGEYWTKELREKSTAQLADALLAHLRDWNLGEDAGPQTIKLYPALAHWNGEYGWA